MNTNYEKVGKRHPETLETDISIYLKFRFPFMRLSVRFLPRLTEEEISGFQRKKIQGKSQVHPNVLSVKILAQK